MRPTNLKCLPNSIQVNIALSEITGKETLLSHSPLILDQGYGH